MFMAQRRRRTPKRAIAQRRSDAENASLQDEDRNYNRNRNPHEVMEVEQDQADECIPSDDLPQLQNEPADAAEVAEGVAKEAAEEKQAEDPVLLHHKTDVPVEEYNHYQMNMFLMQLHVKEHGSAIQRN